MLNREQGHTVLQVRSRDWEAAVTSLRREVDWRREAGTSAAQPVMGIILVELVREDTVAAEKVFREWGGWLDGGQVLQ